MNQYLQTKTIFTRQIDNKPSLNLGIVVVIPAYDEPFLLLSLMSLKKADLPISDIEVIVVINDSEKTNSEIKKKNFGLYHQANDWALKNSNPRLKFHILYFPDLNAKHAGVGFARKIGMDEACWRFGKLRNRNGIIVCFDADSKCEQNYFKAIESHFQNHPKSPACSINFEHPIYGADFDQATYDAIVDYELHLRYFVEAQRWAGFPFAFQTIGSSMAVRVHDYQKQGGMNRRQAGEDFYFLQKFIELGKFTECNTTTVIPSPRPSHRVPFGTGKAVNEIVKSKGKYETYAPESFEDLKAFFEKVDELFNTENERLNLFLEVLPDSVSTYLKSINFEKRVVEIKSNTTNLKAFRNRIFRWFNAFQLMKYMHFARDNYYKNILIEDAAKWIFEKRNLNPQTSNIEYLKLLRTKQKSFQTEVQKPQNIV